MSVFNDFQQVWLQRFPDNPLPDDWEEHIKLNLAKHKEKVFIFKEKVKKEEIYVEYLERLLQDVQKHKKEISDKNESFNEEINDENNDNDVINETTSLNLDDYESISANMCVTEISKELTKNCESDSFVTVIEVNGLKSNQLNTNNNTEITKNQKSLNSTNDLASNEPYYDIVAPEDLLESDNSSTENTLKSLSGTSNYVNIEYFIQSTLQNEIEQSSSDEEDNHHTVSNYTSSSSLESNISQKLFSPPEIEENNSEKSMYKCIILNIIDSESCYVDWLGVLMKYMKAIQATVNTSQPIVTETELNTIFYKIPELYNLHTNFLTNLKSNVEKWDNKVGDCFKTIALNLDLYGAFLSNYGRAVDTVRKCCELNSQFNNITKNITCKHLSKQPINLEDILHKPVAKIQKNALVLHDLIKCIKINHIDYNNLNEALNLTQNFLDQFNMIQTKSMFPVNDRAQRRLVKNSFIVEFVDSHRKLRHLFLFNDVIACAKYKPSERTEKYTFELKWFISVEDIIIIEQQTISLINNLNDNISIEIVTLKSQASNVRDQLKLEEKAIEDKKIKSTRTTDKYRKRLKELESQLVLVSPNLSFKIKNKQTSKIYIFYLSSEFEQQQWIEAIQTLQKTGIPPIPTNHFSMFELQTWITACRAFLKTNMGSYLLRSGHDESLLVGDLNLFIYEYNGIEFNCELYIIIEVDFYGHYFQKGRTKTLFVTNCGQWLENFTIDLEGCENLRILIYRINHPCDTLVGKCTQKLSSLWLKSELTEKKININGGILRIGLKFIPCEASLGRIPAGKAGAIFGEKIQQVCKRQKRDIPFVVTACIREVERRGMSEVGLYRVSGSASDISRLKKSFESNSYEAEQLLKEVDIHSVTGILKLYLRELPEALFTAQLYPSLLEAFNQSNGNLMRRTELLKECFLKLPQQNKSTIKFILEHLIRVHKHESENKMSMHNLATVFGPTLLRPGTKAENCKNKENLASSTVDVMAQAGILYCFLQDLSSLSHN